MGTFGGPAWVLDLHISLHGYALCVGHLCSLQSHGFITLSAPCMSPDFCCIVYLLGAVAWLEDSHYRRSVLLASRPTWLNHF